MLQIDLPAAPPPVQLRQCTVLVGDPGAEEHDAEYQAVDAEIEATTVAIVLIAEAEGRLLAAIPHSAWNRRVSERRLPHHSFVRPFLATAEFVDRASGESAGVRRFWLGFLAAEFEDHVVFDPENFGELEFSFDDSSPSILPDATALVGLWEHHFGFVSAAEPPAAVLQQPEFDARLHKVEAISNIA